MSLPSFKLLRPRTIKEAVNHLITHSGEIQILAGGTDLLPSMKQRLFHPPYVLDIRGLEELRGIAVVPGVGVEIGALTPLSTIEDSEFIRRNYRVLHEAEGVQEVGLAGGVGAEQGGHGDHRAALVVGRHEQQLLLGADRAVVGHAEATQHGATSSFGESRTSSCK